MRIALLLIAFILAVLATPQEARSQIAGDNPCSAVDIGLLPPGVPTSPLSENNISNSSEPDAYPDCGTGQSSKYFRVVLPPDYTNLKVTLDPVGPGNFELALLQTSACPIPDPSDFIPGTDACGPGVLTVTNSLDCLNPGQPVLVKVSGNEGFFDLIFEAVTPTCTDGCFNGAEIALDSIPPPIIQTNSGDSTFCEGEPFFLFLPGAPGFETIVWSDGTGGPTLPVFFPGEYTVDVTVPGGCSSSNSIVINFDEDCVWPGDLDRDDRVRSRDILPLGIAYGKSNPITRPFVGPPLAFTGQFGPDWDFDFAGIYSGLNVKHADPNNDGLCDSFDIAAIEINYDFMVPDPILGSGMRWASGIGSGEGLRSSSILPVLRIIFEADSFEVGDTIRGVVEVGDSAHLVTDLYGYSFELDLPTAFIDTNYFEVDYDTSWLDDDGRVISTETLRITPNTADIGFSRTDSIPRTGYGPLFTFGVVVIDNLDGRLTKVRELPFSFSEVLFLDEGADSIDVDFIADTVIVSEFCDSEGLSTADEYIDGIKVQSSIVISGDNGGYREVTVTGANLEAGFTYSFGVRPGFTGAASDVHWRAWIDFNLDGDYNDSGEMVFEAISPGTVLSSFTVPDTAALGWTTFRIQMKKFDGIAPDPCENIDFGEVEDYIVEIRNDVPRLAPEHNPLRVYPNPASDFVNLELLSEDISWVELWNSQGELVLREQQSSIYGHLDLRDLPSGLYSVRAYSEQGIQEAKLVKLP
jgi:hypothetical protein